ncbi:MAG: 3-isopropylmalate dehydrogenase [Chloroflexi bacterium]|nr:MAG: 3-isopropylmalate dehydrogenase [Chloroflexota bacterium]MBL1193961.1 3-isopropylmalate dehydrogenase [Chloroflexota bacterium]NOH11256.1 3-isopropylmalate dehydrogenase [Chloroflexota bacterium]
MKAKIVTLPGDGIGPEVVTAAIEVLAAVCNKFGYEYELDEQLIGGSALDVAGSSLPEATLKACRQSDAVLLGAVGGPKWDDPNASDRPEKGLLGLRKELGLYANVRPVRPHADLSKASPLRADLLEGVDFTVLRELTGGIYFGEPRERRQENGLTLALDTMVYSDAEISRAAHMAFRLAQGRRGKLTSVDKANVLESSRLWRQTVTQVAEDYPDVELEHLLVDAAAMHLLTRPASFDVIVTSNLFGDILTDEASVLTGSMGNLPSASLGEDLNQFGQPRGLYEPIHGSAPDIAGKGVANPVGTINSLALMLRYSLGWEDAAAAVEQAVDVALSDGCRTVDLAADGEKSLNTTEMYAEVVARIN